MENETGAVGAVQLSPNVTRSPNIGKLLAALAKAQGEVENAAKDRANDYFKSKYADLASVRAAMREPFAKHGLSYAQFVGQTEPRLMGKSRDDDGNEVDDYLAHATIDTLLGHESGEWICSRLEIPVWNPNPQKIGSAHTYGRRYALQAVAGVAPDDDDGNAASQGKARAESRPQQPPRPASLPKAKPRTPEQRETMNRLSKELGLTAPAAEALCREVTGGGPGELTEDTARKLIEAMQAKVLASAGSQTGGA